jgi:aminoglycoside phosphotransferase (APT) family kinase protein
MALTDRWPSHWTQDRSSVSQAGRAAVKTLADLHSVDWRGLGLSSLRAEDASLRTLLADVRTTYDKNQVRELPFMEQISSWLDAYCPDEAEPALAHGDYQPSNILFADAAVPCISAVVDWACSAVRDPLADLGLLLALWDPERLQAASASRRRTVSWTPDPGTWRDLADEYTAQSGRPTTALPFYMVFALFRLGADRERQYADFLAGREHHLHARALARTGPLLLRRAAAVTEMVETRPTVSSVYAPAARNRSGDRQEHLGARRRSSSAGSDEAAARAKG